MTTPPPPPPNYPPTIGLQTTTWWSWQNASASMWTPERIAAAEAGQTRLTAAMDGLSRSITETPEQRRRRLRQEDDYERALQGETPPQRAARHRREDRQHQRAASRLWKVGEGERSRRFRRWCTLTAVSASTGYGLGLVQQISELPFIVGLLIALPGTYWIDLKMRGGWQHPERISALRGGRAISAVLLTRIPVSSVLASLLHLDRLLAASGHLIHHI
ncbi:hypothetical protein [Kitasatospora sp. McL0602]|uniref:hypothetical protein n=1 Tax=Kitasatospora sp. McL0602 TaxID=3439530 RepID=UPI003F899D7F